MMVSRRRPVTGNYQALMFKSVGLGHSTTWDYPFAWEVYVYENSGDAVGPRYVSARTHHLSYGQA
jgi:hypothetical protein